MPTKHPFSAFPPPISFNLRYRAYLRLTKATTRLNWSESPKKWRTCSCGDFLISQYSYSSISIVYIASRSSRIFVDLIHLFHLFHLVYSYSYIHHIVVSSYIRISRYPPFTIITWMGLYCYIIMQGDSLRMRLNNLKKASIELKSKVLN